MIVGRRVEKDDTGNFRLGSRPPEPWHQVQANADDVELVTCLMGCEPWEQLQCATLMGTKYHYFVSPFFVQVRPTEDLECEECWAAMERHHPGARKAAGAGEPIFLPRDVAEGLGPCPHGAAGE